MMSKVRILQFVSTFGVGGTEQHVASLMRHHDRERFELQAACFEKSGLLLPQAEDIVEWPADYPISRLYGVNTWRQQARLARHLRARRVEILHAYGFYANCFAIPAAKLARVPTIIGSIRDIGASWTPMQRRVERTICRLADSVLTNADAAKQKLVSEGFKPEMITVIRNGIEIERFERPRGRCRLREDLGIPPDARLVGVIARIDAVKGLEFFVEAVAKVARSIPDARFVIVGDSFPTEEHQAYHASLKRSIRALGLAQTVYLAGSRSDVPEILADLSLLVLPSLSEGSPNVILESMAAGVPVVASNVGGIPEIIEDGVSGLLVPPRDPRRLSSAMQRVLREHEFAKCLSAAGKETVRARFSVERMARLTEEHYLAVLNGTKRRSKNVGGRGEAPVTAADMRGSN